MNDSTRLLLFSRSRVNVLINLIITTIISVLIMIPIVAMYEVTEVGGKASPIVAMCIFVLFTLLFGFIMSLMTEAKRHELFAASAAYCAILVVFISNFSAQ